MMERRRKRMDKCPEIVDDGLKLEDEDEDNLEKCRFIDRMDGCLR